MSKAILILLVTAGAFSQTKAQTLTTADNLDYVVTVSQNSNWSRCSKLVCKIAKMPGNGDGSCVKYSQIGIISVNLTGRGVDVVEQVSSCELFVELDLEAQALPKLGTSN